MSDPYAGLGVQSAPVPDMTPKAAQTGLDRGSAVLESRISHLPEAQKQAARDKFFQLTQTLRETSATPVSQKRGADATVRSTPVSRRASAQGRADANAGSAGNFLTGLKAGITRGAFGLPERLAAAGEAYLPSAITGNDTNASYDDILAQVRANTDADAEKSGTGNFLGQVLSGGLVGGAAVKPLTPGIGAALGASAEANPVIHTLAAASAAGAAGAGAQALGEGSDVLPAVQMGAVAGPVLHGAVKGAGWLGNKAADVLGLRNAAAILKTVTSATHAEISAKIAALRAKGIEPTIFEVLPMADRNAISKKIVNRSDNTLEATQAGIKNRIGAMGNEIAASADAATAPGRANIVQGITDDMTAARGTPDAPVAEVPGDHAVATRASRSPIDLATPENPGSQLRREARAIMEPHDDRVLYNNIEEILPSNPELRPNGDVHEVPTDPAIRSAILSKAKNLARKNADDQSGGLTGRNISDLLSDLRSDPTISRDVSQSAINHIEDQLAEMHPEFLDADSRMNAAYAARSRMGEGVVEGMNTQTRGSVKNPDRATVNAYDSPEGAQGRFLGQSNQLQTDFAEAGPRKAISQAAALPNKQAAIEQNLGQGPAAAIADTAAAQTEGAQALAGLNAKNGTNANEFGPEELASAVLGLNPGSMIRTKIMSLHKVMQALGMPEKKASNLVDLLFSTNPVKRSQALNMLNSVKGGSSVWRDIGKTFVGGAVAQNAKGAMTPAPPDEGAQEDPGAVAAPAATDDPYAGLGVEDAPVPADVPQDPAGESNGGVMADDGDGADPENPDENNAETPTSGAVDPNQSPQMQELMRQISASGAAPGQENDGIPHGRRIIQNLFPDAHITSDVRSKNDPLSRANPRSKHTTTDEAVDVRPIKGMTFNDFVKRIEDAGHTVIEKKNEDAAHGGKRSAWATGNHWHVVVV
jgi:hypothetical protein